jgi:hypothetical protein
MQVRIFRRRYFSSRSPYARRWMTRILLLSPSTKTYRDMMIEAGFVRAKSQIKHQALISAWFEYFGQEYCHVTNMTAGRISKWLDRLSEPHVRSDCPHPFIFIAGESFLEHHVESPGSYLPQMSCKAPHFACNGALHRSADALEFVEMRKDRWKLVCTCGVSYRMLKANKCDTTRLVPIAYGDRYRNRYCALVARGLNLSSAAQKLSLSIVTGSRWAYGERVGNIKLLPSKEISKLRA